MIQGFRKVVSYKTEIDINVPDNKEKFVSNLSKPIFAQETLEKADSKDINMCEMRDIKNYSLESL